MKSVEEQKQELFDGVATHLLTQNSRSIDYYGNCRYRGDGGLKCALGDRIPDEEYQPGFEGVMPSSSFKAGKAVASACRLTPETLILGVRLQVIHDVIPVNSWKEALKLAAGHEGLSSAVLERF